MSAGRWRPQSATCKSNVSLPAKEFKTYTRRTRPFLWETEHNRGVWHFLTVDSTFTVSAASPPPHSLSPACSRFLKLNISRPASCPLYSYFKKNSMTLRDSAVYGHTRLWEFYELPVLPAAQEPSRCLHKMPRHTVVVGICRCGGGVDTVLFLFWLCGFNLWLHTETHNARSRVHCAVWVASV